MSPILKIGKSKKKTTSISSFPEKKKLIPGIIFEDMRKHASTWSLRFEPGWGDSQTTNVNTSRVEYLWGGSSVMFSGLKSLEKARMFLIFSRWPQMSAEPQNKKTQWNPIQCYLGGGFNRSEKY